MNVLIALLDSDHTSHRAAWEWFREHSLAGWASSPITQNGCIGMLALAVKHDGRLVTFDAGISVSAVRRAKARHLVKL